MLLKSFALSVNLPKNRIKEKKKRLRIMSYIWKFLIKIYSKGKKKKKLLTLFNEVSGFKAETFYSISNE